MSVPSERQCSLHTDSWQQIQNRISRRNLHMWRLSFRAVVVGLRCGVVRWASSSFTIRFSPEPTTFSFALCRGGSLLSASDKLCAIFSPVTNGTSSIARRQLLQLIDGFSRASCPASTFLGRIFLTLSHVEVSSCISQTDQSFLFLAIQLIPLF